MRNAPLIFSVPSPDGTTSDAEKLNIGYLLTSKKSAPRRCLSRRLFLVSIEVASTTSSPAMAPWSPTTPLPLTALKVPWTLAMPHIALVLNSTVVLFGSSCHVPAAVAGAAGLAGGGGWGLAGAPSTPPPRGL